MSAVAAGGEDSLALMPDGTVMAWGNNRAGQLGDGSTANRTTPGVGSGLAGVMAIAAGKEHSLALLSNGTVMSWGSNGSRQLGVPPVTKIFKEEGHEFTEEKDIENSDVPLAVQALAGVTAVAAGAKHSLALTEGGEVEARVPTTAVSWAAERSVARAACRPSSTASAASRRSLRDRCTISRC